jgi:hypothetical protein
MPEATAIITERVRERIRRDGVDLATDRALADRYVRDEVRRYSERALGGSVPMLADESRTAREITAAIWASWLCGRSSTTKKSRRSGSTCFARAPTEMRAVRSKD